MAGANYLHKLGVIHGDFKGVRLNSCSSLFRLVDRVSRRIYSWMTMGSPSLRTLVSRQFRSTSTRSLSPRLLFPLWEQSVGPVQRCCSGKIAHLPKNRIVMRSEWSSMRCVSDGYHDALFFTRHQVLTGRRPFYHLGQYAVVIAILHGERPRKPLNAGSLGFSERLWRLVVRCWDKSPSARPTAQDLLRCLQDAPPIWEPPLEYPIPDDPDGKAEPGSLSRSEVVMATGALTSGFFALLVAVACVFMLSFK